jgi:hypothetical protein
MKKNMSQLGLIYNLWDHRCKIRITRYKKKKKYAKTSFQQIKY